MPKATKKAAPKKAAPKPVAKKESNEGKRRVKLPNGKIEYRD